VKFGVMCVILSTYMPAYKSDKGHDDEHEAQGRLSG
jgi:hypothetical protein